MALRSVQFNRGQGGLGRPLLGEDHYSGAVFYTDTLPSGFSSSAREAIITSVEAAEELGIVDTYTDETAATGTYTVTDAGDAGDTITIKVTEYTQLLNDGTYAPRVVTLCSFTTDTSAVVSTTTMAANIAEQINLGTSTHGYSATSAVAVATITARPGMGASLNSGTPITATVTGNLAGTIAQFSSGVGSELAFFHYHISEFFRLQPQGVLYVGFYAVPGSFTFSELVTLQETFAEGKIRQAMIIQSDTAYAAAQVTAIQSQCTILEGKNMPLSVVYGAKIDAVNDLTTLTDLKTLTANRVSVTIGQDFQGKGWELWNALAYSITDVGAKLGAIALSDVAEDISNPENFNFSSGVELERVGFANGDLLSATSDNAQALLDDRGYLFLIKYVSIAGSYSNSSRTSINVNSDYAFIEGNRAIDKAVRNLNATYTPKLSSKILLNTDGTIRDEDVAYFESLGEVALDQMIRDEELSAKQVNINPSQNVLSTSTLTVSVTLVPVGIAKEIVVNIGYALNL